MLRHAIDGAFCSDGARERRLEIPMEADNNAPKGEPQHETGGLDAHLAMTTNERLSYFGVHEDFDHAAKARNRDGMIAALESAKFDRPSAEGITDITLANPAKYGF